MRLSRYLGIKNRCHPRSERSHGIRRSSCRQELKRAVPKDLGVAGFDHVPHIPYATFMHPEMTTVEVPIYELGRKAASLLIDEKNERIQLPTKLIRGWTCQEQHKGDT